MKLLVTGGCGYVGSLLVGELLDAGHQVKSIDTQWFGNHLKEHQNLINIKKDTRDISDNDLENIDCVIHLANIANDPSVELNPSLSWEVNVLATQQLIEKSINAKIKKFIFASSGSVYGIKDEDKVVEDLPLVPISVYNKTKMIAERTIKSYSKDIKVYSVRPATVCGWSPRMRLDVSVNMFTWQALQNNLITVFGGDQVRPNIHINDMVRVYSHFLNNDIEPGFYNAGFENISILDIAKQIAKKLPDTEIKITESNDPRSYRQDSSKLLQTGFERLYSVSDAIDQIIDKHEKGEIVGDDSSYTVKWMKNLDFE